MPGRGRDKGLKPTTEKPCTEAELNRSYKKKTGNISCIKNKSKRREEIYFSTMIGIIHFFSIKILT